MKIGTWTNLWPPYSPSTKRIDGRSPFANNPIFLARMVVTTAEAILAVLVKPETAVAKT